MTDTCPNRTIKLVRGKRSRKNPPKAVHCDLPVGHPPPCKNGDWKLPKALLVQFDESAK